MKVVANGSIYVQLNDVILLNKFDGAIPASIFYTLYGSGPLIINDSNRYEFVRFVLPNEINFFNSLDWIMDYDEYKNYSDEENLKRQSQLIDEAGKILKKFDKYNKKEKVRHSSMLDEYEFLIYKAHNIGDIVRLRSGDLEFELPPGVESIAPEKKNNGILSKLTKKFFNNKK